MRRKGKFWSSKTLRLWDMQHCNWMVWNWNWNAKKDEVGLCQHFLGVIGSPGFHGNSKNTSFRKGQPFKQAKKHGGFLNKVEHLWGYDFPSSTIEFGGTAMVINGNRGMTWDYWPQIDEWKKANDWPSLCFKNIEEGNWKPLDFREETHWQILLKCHSADVRNSFTFESQLS